MASPYSPPPPPPRRSSLKWLVVAVVAGSVVLSLLFVAAVAVVAVKTGEREEPVTDPVPFSLQPVLEESSPPCASGTLTATDGTACYRLAEGLTVRRVGDAQAGIRTGDTEWTVQVRLEKADADAFHRLTAGLHQQPPPRNRLAIVVEGKVLTAPTLTQPIPGDELEITGNFTQEAATDLARRLQGRRAS
ncbi:SecDF P1 head subdomain-containing protein [Nonomuraea sp. SYSU D8015]|uniref:SecDF P1 head subdomain-containing protein n=1 Tax=Nonomuraea sp. SYSU D8015 TaxID=2593644 RepID=UPI001660A1C5|nr:hypothetical protein [Nonomuraea sp. SYSU D8015]